MSIRRVIVVYALYKRSAARSRLGWTV